MEELYVVIELQKNGDQMANIVTSHNSLASAQNKFYTVAAFAAISTIEKHSVVLLNEDGILVERKTFDHPVVEPEE